LPFAENAPEGPPGQIRKLAGLLGPSVELKLVIADSFVVSHQVKRD
jgi:hypothetical protein